MILNNLQFPGLMSLINDNLGLRVEWRVAMRPGQRRKLEPESEEALAEKAKASVRAKVEHPFLRLKRLFRYARYATGVW